MGKKEEVGSGYLEPKSTGEKQESRVMTISHWLTCRGSRFLAGDAVNIFSLLGPVTDGFFPAEDSSVGGN